MVKDSAGKLQQCSWEDALTEAGRKVEQHPEYFNTIPIVQSSTLHTYIGSRNGRGGELHAFSCTTPTFFHLQLHSPTIVKIFRMVVYIVLPLNCVLKIRKVFFFYGGFCSLLHHS